MRDASFEFLKKMLTTPSPSGYEQKIQEVVRAWAKPLADDVAHRRAWQRHRSPESDGFAAHHAGGALRSACA